MKPFDCDMCRAKMKIQDAYVRWHYDRTGNLVENLQIIHDRLPCSEKGENGYFNRGLSLEYVFKNMPEFLSYISRFNINKKEIKDFVHRIEKERSYIRRFNVDKKEVKKLIIRMDGLGES